MAGPLLAWIVHTLALWVWHVPALFEAALHDHIVHAFQHLSFLAAALLYWSSLVANRHGSSGYGIAVFSLFATSNRAPCRTRRIIQRSSRLTEA